MNVTDLGHALIVAYYYTIASALLIVAWTAWRRGGLLRLTHPLVWTAAAMFFVGCGSHHVDFIYHHLNDEKIDYDSVHHNAFVVMQVVGASAFVAALVPFWKQLARLDLSRRR